MIELAKYIESQPELICAEELVFFGGSFDPWHAGHTSCLELFDPTLPLIILPDHNPNKELVLKSQKQTGEEKLKQTIEKIRPQSFLYLDFLKENQKNPTHKWVDGLKQSFKEKKLSLLIGFDSFISITTWIEAKNLLQNISKLYVVSRLDNEKLKQDQIIKITKISPQIEIIFLGHHDYEHLSSSGIKTQNQ